MEEFELIWKLTSQLINDAFRLQDEYRQHGIFDLNDKVEALKEFCTVRLSSVRRSGHTNAAYNICKEYGALYVGRTQFSINKAPASIVAININELRNYDHKNMIVIDDAYSLSKEDLEKVYKSLSNWDPNQENCLVVLLH